MGQEETLDGGSPSKQLMPCPQAPCQPCPGPFSLLPLCWQSSAHCWEPLAPAECDRAEGGVAVPITDDS